MLTIDEFKEAVLTVLNRSDNGQIRPVVHNLVRVYFKETTGNIPDNSDDMTEQAINELILEGKLKEIRESIGPVYIVRTEFFKNVDL